MKKLLSLLSILTISGTAIPTTIAASPYQKEKKINSNSEKIIRNKRSTNENDEMGVNNWNPFSPKKYYFCITPNTWEFFIAYHDNEPETVNKKMFSSYFLVKAQDFKGYGNKNNIIYDSEIKIVGSIIWDNWTNINNIWQESAKRSRIKINISETAWLSKKLNLESTSIVKNEDIENKYLNKLWTDFDGDLIKDSINLGVLENNDDKSILDAIKMKYKNLEISKFKINEKQGYSFFDKSFFAKIKTIPININKNEPLIYPIQNLGNKFKFITKKWLNEDLPKLIDNEDLIKNWKLNFINWQNETNRQINEDLTKYGNDERGKALKRTWKGNNINELNNKLLSLNHILETIDNKFKLNELYSQIKNLEKDIAELKSQINRLNQKISEIQNYLNKNEDLETCANIGGIISASTGWIPLVGDLISTISGTAAAICTIANA